jgi:hypothetical protein
VLKLDGERRAATPCREEEGEHSGAQHRGATTGEEYTGRGDDLPMETAAASSDNRCRPVLVLYQA